MVVRYHCSPRWPEPVSRSSRSSRRTSFTLMSSVIETIERAQLRRVPNFAPGDRVKVHFQVIEGTRRRVQVFEGVVIKRQGHGARETFTVRKQSFGVGVERMFPVHSPKIERIELAARGDVRRAKLYYLRGPCRQARACARAPLHGPRGDGRAGPDARGRGGHRRGGHDRGGHGHRGSTATGGRGPQRPAGRRTTFKPRRRPRPQAKLPPRPRPGRRPSAPPRPRARHGDPASDAGGAQGGVLAGDEPA